MHPSPQRRIHAAFVIAVALALTVSLASPGSADDKDKIREKRRGVQGQIGGAAASLDQSSKKFSKAAAAYDKAATQLTSARATLTKTRGQLTTAQARDASMQAKLVRAEGQLKRAKTALRRGRKDLRKARIDVKRFTLDSLQSGDRGLRAFSDLLRGQSPTQFSEQMSLSDSVSDAQLASMDGFDASRVLLELSEKKVKKLRDQVAVQRKAAADNLALQKKLEAAAETQTVKVASLAGTAKTAETAAASAKSEDLAELERLEGERSRLSNKLKGIAAQEAAAEARAEARAAARKRRKGGGSSSSPSGGGGGGGGGANGSDGRDSLSRPAAGPITSPYGMRFHPILRVYKLHDGTDFGVPCGTPVRAAAGGRILETYFNSAYGNRIVMRHGRKRGVSVATTYNHLARWAVNPGEKVKRGEIIGYSGNTGYSTGCHLHLMVLESGNVVNPMKWL